MSEAQNILKSSYLNKPILIAALVIFILSGPSCSVKKNNVLSRAFHKTLAHYNGYFNAREKIKEGAKTLYNGEIDRYDRILSVFKYGTEEQAKAIFPEMDEAIKKVSIVIQRHSMEIDGKERNKWIMDCYLLIGTAQFLKHDTWTAIESFQYVAAQYRSEPIRFNALLGLTQCYLRLGKMPDADYLLSTLKDDKEMPTDLKAFYNATYANYYLLQNDLENAALHLEKAKSMTKKRAERYRYAFILGQIYQKLEKHPEAVARYDQVIKLSPPYEMSFNARVNRARSVDVNSSDGKEIRKMLEKMLRDEKNIEYQDQIYYALAEISLKENNVPQAIDLLKMSVATSVSNTNQKALSFLKLAELNFKKPDYKLAQMYYDSTAATISQDHPDYLSIINTKNNLNKLIKNLNTIQTEDSLQALAKKTSGERELIISRMIDEENQAKERALMEKKQREAAEQEAKENMENNPSANQGGNKPGGGNNTSGAGWYFSNPSAVSFGFNEFIRMWGNRKLEDNWRRSTRTSYAEAQEEDEELALLDSTESLDPATRDSILAADNAKRKATYNSSIPLTPEALAKSDAKIVEAYYNVGLIYKEQLKDNKESNKNFETLMQRYPENDYKIPTLYNLYRVNLAMGDEEKAEYYKNIILTQYGDTEYAKIILNPDYFKDQQRKVAIQKVFYENTYRAYLNKQYDDVIERKEMADSLFPASDLAPKFEMLRAMAIGQSRTVPEFEAALKGVVAHYPEDTVSIRAKEILAMINPSMYGREIAAPKPEEGTPSNVVQAPKSKTPFIFNPDTLQYIVFIYTNNVISTNDFKIAISNYNNKFYSVKKLQISNSFVGEENQMIMIRQFVNKQEGVSYLNGLLTDSTALQDIEINMVRYFTITPDNLLLLMQTKDMDGYDAFYEEKYLN